MFWVRVDNRLIHGQVVEAWVPYVGAHSILVGNDDLAQDELQQEIMAQAPAVPLYQPNVNTVYSKRVQGFYLHPVWIFDFLDYSLKQ